jgi:hypothetical protein
MTAKPPRSDETDGTGKSAASDRSLGMDRDISRRDFLNGVAMVAGSLALPEAALSAARDGAAATGAAPGENYP